LRRFAGQPVEARDDRLPANVILPAYSKAVPSPQASLDIFKSHWKSRLPEGFGLTAGVQPMFADRRVHDTGTVIPGGIRGKTVLELGPFEAYNTYHLQKLGAREIVSIEGNNINFLKCLVLKQALGLKASFLHGDFCAYLRNTDRRFDLIWASGVLYHQEDPLELMALIAAHTDTAFFWTHYYDERVLSNANRTAFEPEKNARKRWGDFSCTHYYRSYELAGGNDIPLYFEGGSALSAYWLTFEDMRAFLGTVGLGKITLLFQGELNGLPLASFLAERS
jgi:hypothetical protein